VSPIIALLLGLQLGYKKFCCCLCEWVRTDSQHHYTQIQWPERESLTPGQRNVLNTPFIDPEKVYLPPLHIELGLVNISSRQWIKITLDLCIWKIRFLG
jgi:hypothetical protein